MAYSTTHGSAPESGEIWFIGKTDLVGPGWNLDALHTEQDGGKSPSKKPGTPPRNPARPTGLDDNEDESFDPYPDKSPSRDPGADMPHREI